MAQKVHIVLVDDIDQTDAEETVSFGLDGKEYAIDLNSKNALALRDALAPTSRTRARSAVAAVAQQRGRQAGRRCGPGRDPLLGPRARLRRPRPRPRLGRGPRGVRRGTLSVAP